MHPELLNNATFLRYYEQWQKDPTSVVFAPMAEFLIQAGRLDDAIRVCEIGLKSHTQSVMGRLAMARAYLGKKEWAKSKDQLALILNQIPQHPQALELSRVIRVKTEPAPTALNVANGDSEPQASKWQTVTMAKIYTAQGHPEKAREIYKAILKKDPHHTEARQGLDSL